MDVSLSTLWELVMKPGVLQSMRLQGVGHDLETEQGNSGVQKGRPLCNRDAAGLCLVTFCPKILLNSHISPRHSSRISTKMLMSSPDKASFISLPI